jgi:hypothetical protein
VSGPQRAICEEDLPRRIPELPLNVAHNPKVLGQQLGRCGLGAEACIDGSIASESHNGRQDIVGSEAILCTGWVQELENVQRSYLAGSAVWQGIGNTTRGIRGAEINPDEKAAHNVRRAEPPSLPLLGVLCALDLVKLSRQCEKFLIGQSRKFLLTASRLEGWNELR